MPLNQVSKEGGNFPHFRDAQTLEFGSANRYFVYHLDSKKTDTTEIKLSVPREIPSGSLALTNAQNPDIRPSQSNPARRHRHQRLAHFVRRRLLHSRRRSRHRRQRQNNHPRPHRHARASLQHVQRHHSSPRLRNRRQFGVWNHHARSTRQPGRKTFFRLPKWWMPVLMIGPRTFSSGDPLYAGNGFRNNDLTSLEVTEENIKRLSSYGSLHAEAISPAKTRTTSMGCRNRAQIRNQHHRGRWRPRIRSRHGHGRPNRLRTSSRIRATLQRCHKIFRHGALHVLADGNRRRSRRLERRIFLPDFRLLQRCETSALDSLARNPSPRASPHDAPRN